MLKFLFFFIISFNLYCIEKSSWILIDSAKANYNIKGKTFSQAIRYTGFDCNHKKNIAAAGQAGFRDAVVRLSKDYGLTWSTVFLDSISYFQSPYWEVPAWGIAFPDTNFCIMVGGDRWNINRGKFWISRDFCKTWDTLRLDSNENIWAVKMLNSKTGGLLTGNALYLTNDSGRTWYNNKIILNNLPKTSYLYYIFDLNIIDDNLIILLVRIKNYQDCIIISEDFGKTWSISTSIPIYSEYIQFINKNKGWLGGRKKLSNGAYSEVITYTSDGGKNWKVQLDSLTLGNGVHQLSFLDSLNGLAMSYFARIWRTSDGGNNWKLDTSALHDIQNNVLYSLIYLDTNLIIGGTDEQSQIYKYGPHSVSVPEEPNIISPISEVYPNPAPAGSAINLDFELIEPSAIKIELIDILGIPISEPYISLMDAGKHKFILKNSQNLPAGIYFIRLTINGSQREVRKAVVR
jgi:photosystem II stability/assembly factor-like uncharacterized protein